MQLELRSTKRTCRNCGNTIRPSRHGNARHCDSICRRLAKQKRLQQYDSERQRTERRRIADRAKHMARYHFPDRQPCQECGAEPAERHHDDYNRPLEIRWLCRSCHQKHEAKVRVAGRKFS